MTDSERLRDALLAARSVISVDERERPANDWWGVTIARRHLAALAAAASELVTVVGRETADVESALDAALHEAPTGLEQGRAAPTRAPRMTADDLTGYYVYSDGSLWQLVSYSDQPTATLQRVDRPLHGLTSQGRRSGVVGAPIFDGFRKLVPEAS